MGLVAAGAHLDVDVDGAARVPAGEDRAELGQAAHVRHLHAAAERLALRALDTGVGSFRIAVPDVHGGALDRLAGAGVHDGHAKVEGES